MPGAEPSTPLSAEQPWRGRDPYTEADRAFFHGRRREIEELSHLLQRDTITLLIGAAGTGKTSLVRAGLLPSLSPDWLPVPLTIDWAAASEQRPLSRQVLEAIDAAARTRQLECPPVNPTDSLWEAFHRTGARWWNARQRVVTPVIVIDQFEDAFAVGAANATTRRHRDRLFEELSHLASNRPPSRVASRLEDGTERDDAFDFGPVPVRILLVVREEVAPKLPALRTLFPTLGRSELRLTAFTEAQARDVLMRSAAQRGLFAEGVIDQLLPRLSSGNDREFPFAPATLSAQGRELAELRAQRNVAQITADFFAPPPPTTAPVAAAPEVERVSPSTRRSSPILTLVTVAVICAGAWWWQQHQQTQTIPETEIATSPAKPQPIVESTPLPTPPATPEPQPRVALSVEMPTPVPATPPPATPVPSTPTPAPVIVTATPTPTPPRPESTPAPNITTTIVTPSPSTPTPPPASAETRNRAPEPLRPRERVSRPDPEPARRPATTTIATPVPPRATPQRKPAFVPGGGT